MAKESKIAWTHATFNTHWGCTKVSPGCDHCYAETFSKRLGKNIWGPQAERRFFGDKHWNEPLKWDAEAKESGKPFRVFCASMADVFEDRRDLDVVRARLFSLIEKTSALTWMVLTKRPENMIRLAPVRWQSGWPENVWAGTTIEGERQEEKRGQVLMQVPAVVHFYSVEPLLERLVLGNLPEWVIVGGESGAGCRPMEVEWARVIQRQCHSESVPFFMKQLGGYPNKRDKIEDFPQDLRIQEFPVAL